MDDVRNRHNQNSTALFNIQIADVYFVYPKICHQGVCNSEYWCFLVSLSRFNFDKSPKFHFVHIIMNYWLRWY